MVIDIPNSIPAGIGLEGTNPDYGAVVLRVNPLFLNYTGVPMKRFLFLLLIGALLPALTMSAETGQVKLSLARLDCGTIQVNDLNVFSDTEAYTGRKMTLVDGCYLLRHGDDYLLWDTGLPASLKGAALSGPGPMAATVNKTIVC